MKAILSLRRHHYLRSIGILLIVVALVAGIISCVPADKYELTMAVNPAGSGTAQDLTGASPYAANTKVDIKATALGSYKFVKWTAPAGTFGDPNLATTTFTMPAQNVTATAHFVGPLDHFKGYMVSQASPLGINVHLKDQFVDIDATVEQALGFANPTEKVYGQTTDISNPDHHLTVYNITCEGEPVTWYVEVHNQFGTQNLTVWGPIGLAVPTQKVAPGNHTEPLSLDHYLLYLVMDGPSVNVNVGLKDEFGNDPSAMVGQAVVFANPVQKTVGTTVTNIAHPDEHLVFYYIDNCQTLAPQVQVVNQFNTQTQTLNLGEPAVGLAVPSEELSFAPAPDRFTGYIVDVQPYIGEVVYLEDQFCAVNATVEYPTGVGYSATKWHNEVWTPISHPDYCFTGYTISYEGEPGTWQVEVKNQFGIQTLTVYGPVGLSVPTQKEGHEAPVGLDHYLAYEVIAGLPVNVVVGLHDEFGYHPDVLVDKPIFFLNPVRKTHDGVITEIENPEAHFVSYLLGVENFEAQVQVVNQFGEQTLDLFELYARAEPSEMLSWQPIP